MGFNRRTFNHRKYTRLHISPYIDRKNNGKLLIILVLVLISTFLMSNNEFKTSITGYATSIFNSTTETIEEVLTPKPQKELMKDSFDYVNELRESNGVRKISWDEGLYNLALYKVKDMYERGYFDHPDPEGRCVESFKQKYNIRANVIMDNLGKGYSTPKEAIDGWMRSRGHRYNLLMSDHTKGAVAFYGSYYIFIGAHYMAGASTVCDKGANNQAAINAGLAYVPGEISAGSVVYG